MTNSPRTYEDFENAFSEYSPETHGGAYPGLLVICGEFGISMETANAWVRRYEREHNVHWAPSS